MKRLLGALLLLGLLAVGAAAAWMYMFAQTKIVPPQASTAVSGAGQASADKKTAFEFTVKPGTSLIGLSRQFVAMGLLPEPHSLVWLAKLTKKTEIHAGSYRLSAPLTPEALLDKLVNGDVIPIAITFVEGSTFKQMLETIAVHPAITNTIENAPPAKILKLIGATETYPEGLFFPDTYQFSSGASDIDVLKRAYQTMQKRLGEAWAKRDEKLPYKSPYEALIMASIIEKETGRAFERPEIGAVFVNRLRIPMRLQTDPTVIYGMGEKYDGNIRKRDLTTDTAYNTYTRDGLPPTPIAMPGQGAIDAALNPAVSDKLYFVARGDGTHYFSRSLEEHNRAVQKFQLGR
jgi:UPF0755 protein